MCGTFLAFRIYTFFDRIEMFFGGLFFLRLSWELGVEIARHYLGLSSLVWSRGTLLSGAVALVALLLLRLSWL